MQDLAHLISALALLGNDLAKRALVGCREASDWPIGVQPVDTRSVEIGEVALGGGNRGSIVGDAQVDHAIRVLHVDRADFTGLVDTEATALDHRGTAHAMLESSVAITTSQHPSSAALPAKQ